METYIEMKNRHEKEFGSLPIAYAFSKTQFEEGCRKLGVTDPGKELYKLGETGGFYRRNDSKLIWDTIHRHDSEMTEAMKVEEFAVSAFEYEASNHEFHINLDPHFDMANCFGFPCEHQGGYGVILWDKMPNGEFLKSCYEKGVRNFLKVAQY